MKRVIMHMDMNAFFASVEQRCDPALRGRPIAVIGSGKRTIVTTASYEARAFGVKTGMNTFEAKKACPGIILVVGNNRKYMDTSVRILDILKGFSPLVEAYSIDEAFVDISGTEALLGPPSDLASAVKKRIMEATGLTCSIGIAPNKLLAKLASDMRKPDGLVVIKDDEVESLLKDLPAKELLGIGPRLNEHLASMGIRTCGELGAYPASALRDRFGIIGERLKLMGQGIDYSPVVPVGAEPEARSVGHSMTLESDISDRREIGKELLRLSEMVGRRARRYGLKGRRVSLTIRYPDFYTFSRQKTLAVHVNDTRSIYSAALMILNSQRLRSSVRLLGISISDMISGMGQMELFDEHRKRDKVLKAMDEINSLFGDFTVTWGTLLDEGGPDKGPGVISPSWRPVGVKHVNVR